MSLRAASVLAAVGLLAGSALAATPAPWSQGFETDASGWFDNDDFAGYGNITRVNSPLTAFEGSFYAEVSQAGTGSSPFTRWGGYTDMFPAGGFTTSAAIYLSPSTWTFANNNGFDFSSAANGADGNHRRDFVFHVAVQQNGDLLVAGSNNSGFTPRHDLASLNNYNVTADGWYIFESVFRDNGGVLAVDLNLRDAGGALLFTETRSDASDLIGSVVGGNRYGWFTFTNQTTSVDAASIVPAPAAAALLGLGGLVAGGRRRRA